MSKVPITSDVNKKYLSAQHAIAITRLTQIETANAMTNAQLLSALKDMAKILRLLLKFMARNINEG